MGKYKYPIIGLITLTILLFVYYGKFIINADHTSFATYGDGYKNYYTLAHYLKYDSGSHFGGMNYPYGENVIYTDNQPLTAWLLKPFTKLFPSMLNHVQAIIVWLLMLGHLFSYLIIYKVLLRFKLPSAFAALFAVFIVMLSPQLVRLNGHFSLGYTVFIPLLIWWLVRLVDSQYSPRYLFCIFLLLSAGIFVHPYYFAMSALFIVSLSIVMAVRAKGLIGKATSFSPILSVVAALLVFKAYVLFTDSIADRPSSPWGFVMSRSTVADILLHPTSVVYQALNNLFPKAKIVFHGEGAAYIGLVGIVACLFYILYLLIPAVKRKFVYLNIPDLSLALFVASIPVLLFAMAFPFSINTWFEGLLSYMPSTIKQFRAAGRFSWVFYYVMGICTAIFCYRVYISMHHKKLAIAVLGIAVVLWFIDVNTMNNGNKRSIDEYATENYEQREVNEVMNQLAARGFVIDNFQAILPIPFFLNGSEKLYIETPHAYFDMRFSNVTGLPIAGGQMSRTSIAQTFKLANLLSSPYIRKDIVKDFGNNKPLLMYVRNATYTAEETALVNKGKLIYESGDNKYYELSLNVFNDSIETVKQSVKTKQLSLVNHGDYATYNSLPNCVVKTFDDQTLPYAVFGKGATYVASDQAWLWGDTLPYAVGSTEYEVSIWMYADRRIASFPMLYVNQVDANGNEIEKYDCRTNASTNTYGNWVRMAVRFTLRDKANKIYISGSGDYATYDELIIRPATTDIVTHKNADGSFMYNNFPIY